MTAATHLARFLLYLIGAAAWAALFTVKIHAASRLWPVITTHDPTLALVVLAGVSYLGLAWLVGLALYSLGKAALGGDT